MSATSFLPQLAPLGKATGFLEEIMEVLAPLTLFEGFSVQECALLCEYLDCYGATSKSTIITEGEAGDFLFIVLTGRIHVIKRHGESETRVVATVGPGGFVGEMSLIDGKPRFASCVAAEPADLAVLTREQLNRILPDHPRLGQKLLLMLLRLMTSRLRETTVRVLPYIAEGSI